MAIRQGEWSTASVYDGSTYYGWHKRVVPVTITVADAGLKALAENQGRLSRAAYNVEVLDRRTTEVTAVPSVKSISITRNVQSSSDQAGFAISDASKVSPRIPGALQGKLKSDIRLWVRVNAGFRIKGVDKVVRVFAGLLLDRSEEWSDSGSGCTLQALSLSYLLSVTPAVLTDYTGSTAGALLTLLEGSGFPAVVMAFEDQMIETPLTIVEPNLEAALGKLFEGQGTVTWRIDNYGCLVVQAQGDVVGGLWNYKSGAAGNLYKLRPGESGRAVTSQVAVTGADVASSGVVMDPAFVTRFGVRRGSVSSNAVTTAGQKDAAGAAEIARSARALKKLGVTVGFNPLLEPLDQCTVLDAKFGSKIDALMDVLRFTLSMDDNGAGAAQIDGETDQEM